MRILIADDEPIAVERLELALSCIPEAELAGIARNGREALMLIKELQPDVAILDIEMPGQNGFGVLSALKERDKVPEVIFVTAYDNHAVKAFEVKAVDYLLKPVSFDRLRSSLRLASERLKARTADARFAELQEVIAALSTSRPQGALRFERDIWVRDRDGVTRVPVDTIDLLEAAGDYVIAHVGDTTHLLSDSISGLEKRLDPSLLMRVHRSAIANLKGVRGLRRRGARSMALMLQSGKLIAVGPSYLDRVLEAVHARRWR